jgi:hypothetical protein
MGYLIGNGYAEVIGDENDIDSLRDTVTNFFSSDSSRHPVSPEHSISTVSTAKTLSFSPHSK